MKKKPLDSLGELQRTVLETVWELGEASVHEVRKSLGRKKKLAYTTVLSAMQKLEKAGWLDHRAEGKSYVYFATQSRAQAGAGSLQGFLKRVYEGDALSMFQHLIQQTSLSADELAELKRLIEQREKEGL
ncbi:MAG: BlaI/MecI/CopY family transcriptional regulator [Sedimentisphaerales bacterium]|nr:BlaI/MecI/CopY family transcriptional regulator [Sedimentisphaerales bacterium]